MKSEKNKIKVNATVAPFKSIKQKALANLPHLFSSRTDAGEKAIGTLFSAINSGKLCECVEPCGITMDSKMLGRSVSAMG